MRKWIQRYDLFEERLLAFSLVVTVAIIFLQVVMRKGFNSSLAWSEELARYIFIWQIWLGISIGFREKAHIRVELVLNACKGIARKVLDTAIVIILILFLGFLTYQGFLLIDTMIKNGITSAALRIPLWCVYVSLPVSCFISMIRLCFGIFGVDGSSNMTSEKE